MAADGLVDQLLVAVAGPLLTAVLGLLVANFVTKRAQQRREVQEARQELAHEVADCATSLYLELQAFWRSAEPVPLKQRGTSEALADKRKQLAERYTQERLRGRLVEQRILVCFADERPRQRWHATMELLSTRYLLLLEGDGEKRKAIRRRKAGNQHTGLSADELNDPRTLLRAIRRSLADTLADVWTAKLTRQDGMWTPRPPSICGGADAQAGRHPPSHVSTLVLFGIGLDPHLPAARQQRALMTRPVFRLAKGRPPQSETNREMSSDSTSSASALGVSRHATSRVPLSTNCQRYLPPQCPTGSRHHAFGTRRGASPDHAGRTLRHSPCRCGEPALLVPKPVPKSPGILRDPCP